MAPGEHVEITKEGIATWFHKLRKNLYEKLNIFSCTPDDALVVRNILSFSYKFYLSL
jgi:hypothetical protein